MITQYTQTSYEEERKETFRSRDSGDVGIMNIDKSAESFLAFIQLPSDEKVTTFNGSVLVAYPVNGILVQVSAKNR